jgi:hypothetical protein
MGIGLLPSIAIALFKGLKERQRRDASKGNKNRTMGG